MPLALANHIVSTTFPLFSIGCTSQISSQTLCILWIELFVADVYGGNMWRSILHSRYATAAAAARAAGASGQYFVTVTNYLLVSQR